MSSSPIVHWPSTPASRRSTYSYTHKPIHSSPLASPTSVQFSSPIVAAQARRKSQYKSCSPSTPIASSSMLFQTPRSTSSSGVWPPSTERVSPAVTVEDSQKTFLRERFRARCIERATKERARAVSGKRYVGQSDGFDELMDEDCQSDEDDDTIMGKELYQCLVFDSKRKSRHSYRVSYEHEVGDSFDPDMEDVTSWESELKSSSQGRSLPVQAITQSTLTPEELEEEELAAYAEEYARQAAAAEFEDISVDDLYWSDGEELDQSMKNDDVDMEGY